MTPTRAFNPIRALESSWRLLNRAPLPLWLGGLILALVDLMGQSGGRVSGNEAREWAILIVFFGLIMWVVTSLASAYLSAGYFSTVRDVMRTGSAEFEDVFKARGRFLALFLARIARGLLLLCGLLPAAIPPTIALMLHAGLGLEDDAAVLFGILGVLAYVPVFVYIALGLSFVDYAVVLDGASIGDAMSRSWQLARGNRLRLLLLLLSSIALVIIGLMLCCVGILPAVILIHVMWCEAYVQATRDGHDPESWWVDGQGGPDSPSSVSSSWSEAAEATDSPLETRPTTPPTTPGVGEAEGAPPSQPFDPGRWRDDADIPPIDDRE